MTKGNLWILLRRIFTDTQRNNGEKRQSETTVDNQDDVLGVNQLVRLLVGEDKGKIAVIDFVFDEGALYSVNNIPNYSGYWQTYARDQLRAIRPIPQPEILKVGQRVLLLVRHDQGKIAEIDFVFDDTDDVRYSVKNIPNYSFYWQTYKRDELQAV